MFLAALLPYSVEFAAAPVSATGPVHFAIAKAAAAIDSNRSVAEAE